MTLADWAIVIVLAVSTLEGLTQGFIRSVCSLGGLLLGLALAAWNYASAAALIRWLVRADAVANAIGFLAIVLFVAGVINWVGAVLQKALNGFGLGCVDLLGGAFFGFAQGILLTVICILITVVFFPQTRWLTEAKLPRMFFGACDASVCITPYELGTQIRKELRLLEEKSPRWMHLGNGVS